jgi:hypothetical protein
MKRLAGTPNPRSWKETKLTTYPGGGVGSASLAGAIHSGCGSPERGWSKPSATRASRSSTVTMEKGYGSRGGRRSPCQPSLIEGGGGGGDKVRGFLFSGYSLRLRKPKQKASANGRVKNHRRPLFRVYKGLGEIHSKLHPNPPRNSNSKAKRPFLERLEHAQRPPRESPVPSH